MYYVNQLQTTALKLEKNILSKEWASKFEEQTGTRLNFYVYCL